MTVDLAQILLHDAADGAFTVDIFHSPGFRWHDRRVDKAVGDRLRQLADCGQLAYDNSHGALVKVTEAGWAATR